MVNTKEKSVDGCFDDLQKCAERMSRLLSDRQRGLLSWNEFLLNNGKEMIKCLQNLGFKIKVEE